ncbi:uncharacterized protein LOC144347287, partial [Saccoglossus kowalevskii]
MVKKRKYCPHCDDTVTWKTFKRHRGMYYNSLNDQWACKNEVFRDDADYSIQSGVVEVEDLGDDCTLVSDSNDHADKLVTDTEISSALLEEDKIYLEGETDEMSPILDGSIRTEIWDNITEEDIMIDLEEAKTAQETPVVVDLPFADQKYMLVILNWLCIFVCYFWTFFNISDNGITVLLTFLKTFFSVSGRVSP